MAGHRHHSRVLIAGLVQIGIIGCLGGTAQSFFPHVDRALGWIPAAFVGGVVARRAMSDLSLGQLAIAVAVTIATLLGLMYQRDNRSMDTELATRVALVVATAVVAGFAGRRVPVPRAVVLGLAAGGAGVGALLLALGLVLLFGDSGWVVLTVYGCSTIGVALAVRFVDGMRTRHAALGLGVFFAFILAAQNQVEGESLFAGIAGGTIFGWIVGAIGGGIGTRLARRAERTTSLPEIRQIK
jgi:hypothetical protein